MTKDTKHIHSYYSSNDLYNRIIAGLNEIGKEVSKITLEDLHPVDEFHIRGTVATKELIQLSDFTSDMQYWMSVVVWVAPRAGWHMKPVVV